ncbi:glycosyl transferase [Alsobacter metallidurans]|uniref:Glycosyl transferase n=1 Tax=Alsobacter metallidurans TaxID=340221 RepID=A0A917I412_9HYPH|nr:glycosyltransferase [Alsobacter metallidurans]GGH12109.1 glycosyl transferase [Alsobacter metallidurans]
MLSVIIPVLDDEPALLDTVAALVPAAAEGVVRDMWLVAPRLEGYPAVVADAAGCGIVEAGGSRGAMLAAAAARARSAWTLTLEPGLVPAGGWMQEAADFVASADGEREAAVFSLTPRGGHGRLAAGMTNWRASLFGRGRPAQGLIVATARLAAGNTPPRAVRLASPIIDRRSRG